MTKANPLRDLMKQDQPWSRNKNKIWLASTATLHRNLEKFHFPLKLNGSKRKQIISLTSKGILNSQLLKNPFIVKAEDLEPGEKEYLVEHFLSSQSFQQAHSGEAFILDETGEFFVTLNLRDHLSFEMIDCSGQIENSWNRLIKLETELANTANFAFSPRFGFLTSDPHYCGTGFILEAYFQPAALIHTGQIEPVLNKILKEGLSVAGLTGSPEEIVGDVIVVRNNYTLGLTEENIISSIRLFTTKLLVEENSARSELKNSESEDMKDMVSRAYGILVHSYKIEAVEALEAISLLKLGLDLGWIKGVKMEDLNLLFFSCRRAHLLSNFSEEVPQEEILHKRAEFIHQMLEKTELLIG